MYKIGEGGSDQYRDFSCFVVNGGDCLSRAATRMGARYLRLNERGLEDVTWVN
jgi:hypothetical protein